MKKFVLFLTCLLLTGVASRAQWSVGAGYASSSLVARVSPSDSGEKSVFYGLYAGVSYALPVAGGIRFTPGVYYEYLARGAKAEVSALDFLGETREHYLSVPLRFEYGLALSPDLRFLVFAGPSLRLGLDSATSYSIGWGVRDFEVVKGGLIDHNYNDGDYSRFDILVGGGLALELLSRWRLQIGYDAGQLNRYTAERDLRLHANRLTAGIACLF